MNWQYLARMPGPGTLAGSEVRRIVRKVNGTHSRPALGFKAPNVVLLEYLECRRSFEINLPR